MYAKLLNRAAMACKHQAVKSRFPTAGGLQLPQRRFLSSNSDTLPWEWVPPSNSAEVDLQQDMQQEELDAPLAQVSLDSRKARAEKWTMLANKFMSPTDGLIKVKTGVPLTEEEIISALEVNKAKDIVSMYAEGKGQVIICTALSSHHLKRLVTILYKSMRARELRFADPTKPFFAAPHWVFMECGFIFVNLFTEDGRKEVDLETILQPGFKEKYLEEIHDQLDVGQSSAPRIRHRGKRPRPKHFRLTKHFEEYNG